MKTVLANLEETDHCSALVIKASALYFGGDFEHALVSFHQAQKKGFGGKVERNDIREGIRNAEIAIKNSLARSDGEVYSSINKVVARIPHLMTIPLFALNNYLDDIHGSEMDNTILGVNAEDAMFLYTLMDHMQNTKNLKQGTRVVVERVVLDLLKFIEDREDFWNQQDSRGQRKQKRGARKTKRRTNFKFLLNQ